MARLEVSWPDGRSEYVDLTHRKPVSIGSHSVSDVVVEDAGIAALACRIAWNGDTYEAVAAANDDIYVNDKATRRKSLKDGDELSFGDVRVTLERGSEKRFQRREKETEDRDEASEEEASAVETPQRKAPDRVVDNDAGFADIDEREYDELVEDEIVDRDTKSRIRSRLNARTQRPGQQDATRSPLVYGLAGGVVVLLVATVALTLFIRGQSIEQQFQAAVASVEANRYSEAAQKLERFIDSHPVHPLADRAERLLAVTQVDQKIRGAAPDWLIGYRGLNDVINQFRDDDDFSTLYGDIAERAGFIALGAAADAGKKRDRDLVGLSEQAEAMLAKYSPDAIPPETLLERIVSARNASRERLVQLDVLDEFLDRMTRASEEKKHLDVLTIGRQLTEADATLGSEAEVQKLVSTATDALRQRVKTTNAEELDKSAVKQQEDDRPTWASSPIAVVERAVGEAKPSGTPVFVWTADTYFAVDAASGDPMWWHVWPDSFAPVEIEIPRSAVVAYNRNNHSLELAARSDGRVFKSITLPPDDATPRRPTVIGAVAFVPFGQSMLRVDLDSGMITSAVNVGQPVLARPTIVQTRSGSEALLVLGARETAYLVDTKSMDLIEMFVVGHQFGAIVAEPIAAAEFIVVAVNQMARDNCRLLLLWLTSDANSNPTLTIADEVAVDGLVLDVPVLRGRDLFVASSAETVTVYTVSDENGGGLTPGPAFRAGRRNASPVPVYLLADADREFWMAGSRLRRLRATPEAIRPVENSLPLGSPVAVPTLIGPDVYPVSRRGLDSTATLSRVNVDDLRERWQVHFEADAIGILPSATSGRLCVVTEHGDVTRVDLAAATGSEQSIASSAVAQLVGRPDHVSRVGEQLAISVGKELFLLDERGRIARLASLGNAPTMPVVPWGDRLIVPLPGKIKILGYNGREVLSEFWLSQGPETSQDWKSIVVIDEMHLATLDSTGTIRRLTVVSGDSPHLAETLSIVVTDAQSLVFAPDSEALVVSNGQEISQFDARSLAPVAGSNTPLEEIHSLQSIAGSPVVVGERDGQVVVERLAGGTGVTLPTRPIGKLTDNPEGIVVTLDDRVLLYDANLRQLGDAIPTPSVPADSAFQVGDQIILPLANGFIASIPLGDISTQNR